MKKIYIAPEVESTEIVATTVICTSVKFGDGSTDSMNAKEFDFEEEEDVEW